MSFYGGKEGRSYHIVHKYSTIKQMVDAFKLGGQYTTVNFGEYVIIDTANKQDPTNGCLYRRGFDYLQSINETYTDKEQPGAGAIYIGQIVGPSGRGPNVIAEVNNSLPSTASLTVASTVTGEDAAGNIEQVTLTFSFPKLQIIPNEITSSAYAAATVTENAASTNYPYKYLLDFRIPAGKHGNDASISFNNDDSTNQYFEINTKSYQSSSEGSIIASSTIPYRIIDNITASTIAGSTYARVMDISYTSGSNSTIMPTQIDNITTDSTNFIIKLSNVTESISVPIPSANLKISGTAASTASLPTEGVEDGTIMEVNSKLYLYQNPNWTEIFSSLFDNLSNPENYVQVGTDSSSLLNNGVLFVTSTFNNYWDN